MPKKGEVDLQKLKYWKAVLRDFDKSGLSGQAYCKQAGIAYTAFANRRRRLATSVDSSNETDAKVKTKTNFVAVDRMEASAPPPQMGFAEVAVKVAPSAPPAAHGERLEIVFPTGTMLRVPSGYSVAALVEIVTALEVQ